MPAIGSLGADMELAGRMALVQHGLDPVDDEVDRHLFRLGPMAHDVRQVLVVVLDDHDVRGPRLGLRQEQRLVHQVIHVEPLIPRFLPA